MLRAFWDVLSTLRDVLVVVKVGLSVLVVFGGAAAFLAVGLPLPVGFAGSFVSWFLGLGLASLGVLAGLRALRQRRFGDAPSSAGPTPFSAVLDLGGVIAGSGGLWLCVPHVLRGEDVVTWSVGALLCARALALIGRGAFVDVTRP